MTTADFNLTYTATPEDTRKVLEQIHAPWYFGMDEKSLEIKDNNGWLVHRWHPDAIKNVKDSVRREQLTLQALFCAMLIEKAPALLVERDDLKARVAELEAAQERRVTGERRVVEIERDLLRALILHVLSDSEERQKSALQALRALSEAWEKTS